MIVKKMTLVNKIQEKFKKIFNTYPLVVRSPGRINLIGEHTDYNGGFVLPAAIDKYAYIAVSARNDGKILLYSESYDQHHEAELANLQTSEKGWPNYVLGVVDQLIKDGFKIGGFNLYLEGDIPTGAGLSSSAAVECATAFALVKLFDLKIPKMKLALLAQKAEHEFAGVRCGIMDQFASVFGKQGAAMRLDCRSLEYEYVPLDLKGHQLVLLNTNVKHKLADSAYNKRRSQCEQGVAWVKEDHAAVESLRDVTQEQLDLCVQQRDEDVYRKCSYVLAENQRLIAAVENLKQGDLEALGKKMYETHEGLSKAYEVSCPELDFLVEQARQLPKVLGARMMGGGFGGCTINLVGAEFVEAFVAYASKAYEAEFKRKLSVYPVSISEGTELINTETVSFT